MGLRVNYIIKRPKGKMTYRILDVFYTDGLKFFKLENLVNGKVYHTKAEDNWQYYGRVYDTIKPKKIFTKFNF